MTTRLSASSLAGTARTLVAVGTVSDAFMFFTTLAAAPRSGERLGPDGASSAAGRLAAGLAGAAGACFEVRSAARFTTVASVRAATGGDRGAGSGAPGATAGLLGRVAEPSASAGAGLVAGADGEAAGFGAGAGSGCCSGSGSGSGEAVGWAARSCPSATGLPGR